MTKYAFKPYKISEYCFLLEALYWAAFNRYPAQITDISKNENFSPEIIIKYDENGNEDWISSTTPTFISPYYSFDTNISRFLNPKTCKEYGLPINPDFNHYNFMLERAKELVETGILCKELDETEEDIVTAKQYLQEKEIFDKALNDYLDIFKAKILLALHEGKIKSYGILSKKEYIYNDKTRYIFENMDEYGENNDKTLYQNIKDGDSFYATDPLWEKTAATPIPSNYWISNRINWEKCTLEHEIQRYVYVQINTDDLMDIFPATNIIKKEISKVGNAYIFDSKDNNDIDINTDSIETRGRKPKIDHNKLILDFISNIDKYRNQKLDSVIAEFQHKYPQVGRTTLFNKLSPLMKACNQK